MLGRAARQENGEGCYVEKRFWGGNLNLSWIAEIFESVIACHSDNAMQRAGAQRDQYPVSSRVPSVFPFFAGQAFI